MLTDLAKLSSVEDLTENDSFGIHNDALRDGPRVAVDLTR